MKKAIIVGATSGIGKRLAEVLVENDHKVGITGRRTELLDELKQKDPDSYFTRSFDITDINKIDDNLEELTSELGGLDLLVISSGTGDINKELDFEVEKRTIDTNVTGFTRIADWAFDHFQKQTHGHLAAITSVGGLRGSGESPSYNATKSYQMNYLEGLRQKAAKESEQISITDIRPGLVDTAMAKGEGLFWVMPVEKTVQQIHKAIRRKKRIAYVTKRWGVLARILKRIPNMIYDRM